MKYRHIIITGAAGFIGSQVALEFSKKAEKTTLVDHQNLFKLRGYVQSLKTEQLDAAVLAETLNRSQKNAADLKTLADVDLVIHMGAITNTAASDQGELNKWNVDYTKTIWTFCAQHKIPLIYASSAATYGNGTLGFNDDHSLTPKLKPLNLYGQSKQTFDLWALEQKQQPPHWYGLKFFNVYGPNENHKERMASSVWHGFNEIKKNAAMTLFKSHNPLYKDGEQARDFIYVGDLLKIMEFLLKKSPQSGLYNCGTGNAGKFLQVAEILFKELNLPLKINWVDTPEQFRKSYQYKTQANTEKLLQAGYEGGFTSLKEGIKNYLQKM